jgi:hypothetical protein
MAARKNKPLHDDKTKERIRASQLLNRLNSFAIGEIEMTAAQVNAAKIVIGKVVPDLKSVELANRDGEELKTVSRIVREIVDPAH